MSLHRVSSTRSSKLLSHPNVHVSRTKELRCSGDTTGCTRCEALSRSCVYNLAGQMKTRRHTNKSLSSVRSSVSQAPISVVKDAMPLTSDDGTYGARTPAGADIQTVQKSGSMIDGVTPKLVDSDTQVMQWEGDRLEQVLDFDVAFSQGTEK
jgi:hypothetical protein